MIAMPDPSTFAVLPWRPAEQGVARMFCDIVTPERTPYEGDPRYVLRRALRAGRGDGLRPLQRRPRARVLLLPRLQVDRGARRGRLLRPDRRSTPARDLRRETVLALEQLGIHTEYTHHEVGPSQHEIDMRYADALKMADDCMTYRITVKEYAMKYGLPRDVHAQAAVRRERLGDAHPPVAVPRRQQRVLRRRRPVLPVGRRQGVHRRPAAPRARDQLDLRPVGQLLQAPGARATRRRCTSPGRAATARRWSASRSTTPARSRRRAWSCAARTRRATRT